MKKNEMKKNGKKLFLAGSILIAAFAIWTLLIQTVDVQSIGQNGTDIGFATLNQWFHELTGVHMGIYDMTDCLEMLPLGICGIFGVIGAVQWIKRKSLFKVDYDIILLGIYYVIVILAFVLFEIFPVNYRPVLIEGKLEASYPSSTTLLVLSVMPAFMEQIGRRLKNASLKRSVCIFSVIYMVFMVIGRLVSGVHWITDIVGAVLFSSGVFCLYRAGILLYNKNKRRYSDN